MAPPDKSLDASHDVETRWDRRWSQRGLVAAPAAFVVEAARFLPEGGEAVDVAGGNGRHAIYLASRGLRVTLVDASSVALGQAAAHAADRGVGLTTLQRDLHQSGLPSGPWEVVLIYHFLDRSLLAAIPGLLRPRGVLVFCQPTMKNLERHDRPGQSFLLGDGEIHDLSGSLGLQVLTLEEGWGREGRHEARLVARKARA